MARCKCSFCNAPDVPHHCFDCGHEFRDGEEEWKDRAENPICYKCNEKRIEKMDALLKMDKEDEAWRRSAPSRKYDADQTARRMPYNDGPTRGWWKR